MFLPSVPNLLGFASEMEVARDHVLKRKVNDDGDIFAAEDELLAQANAYFNGITTLTGSFIQIGADGRRIGGKLTLAKPGRLRFDYDQPSPLEVVADGTSVAVKDRKLGTQDLYFISQTPLKFLLRDKIDLAQPPEEPACQMVPHIIGTLVK